MSIQRQRPALESYIAEISRLRAVTFDDLTQEIDRLDPLWVNLRVVPRV